MKSIIIVLLVLSVSFTAAIPSVLLAEEKKGAEEKAGIPEGFKKQSTCPVMGGKLDGKSHIDYQGQRIHFCCAGCEQSFLKSPDKYFEQAAKDKVLFENVQTTCPVTGNPIDKKYFTYYKGRGIYFCCANCIETFKADPEKYLEVMEGKEKKKGHEKHDHKNDEKHGHNHDHKNG